MTDIGPFPCPATRVESLAGARNSPAYETSTTSRFPSDAACDGLCLAPAGQAREANLPSPIERSIRPLVLGRKNYMFAGSHQGAKRLAMIYSFTGSCSLSGVNPQAWFTDVLTRIQDTKQSELINLLPHKWSK